MTIREYSLRYCQRSDRIAAASYFGTYLTFFAALIGATLLWGYWLSMAPLVVVAAFAGVRLYVLQHDCGHLSLFTTRARNVWAGYGLSLVTLTPFRAMQYNHNLHHANVGNLDHRETGEVYTMTLREWETAPWLTRLGYRLYRNPVVMIVGGGLFVYFLRYRWPKNAGHVGWPGVAIHNLMVLGFFGAMYLLFGWPGLLTLVLTAIVASWIGVFLVYLQHNFENTHWGRKPELDFETAVLKGSSALDLGWLWDLGTGNIAYHDIHHLNPRIPSYNLRRCHREMREIMQPELIGWREAFRSFTLKLWDEDAQKLVPFPREPVHRTATLTAQ
jgi:omega-6 fatty acid desaturase (delta-12 desaturase)